MRIITRYILREVASHALLGGVLFTFVLFIRPLAQILELAVRDSASLSDVLRIFAYLLPNALKLTIPMAVLVGILLGLSRLASDSEITAMRASGMGPLGFVRIVSIISAVAVALGLFNTLYLVPHAAKSLISLDNTLKSSQASFEIEPRVFYEDFKNYVLYVQDVRPSAGAALWRHVFLADLTQPATPHITTADSAVVVSGARNSPDAQTLRLHLLDGSQHQTDPNDPNQYNISTFSSTEIPIETGAQEDTHLTRNDTPVLALPLSELMLRVSHPDPHDPQSARIYRIEFNNRFAYPLACLVLMLVGVPLGLSSKRGGKSTGFVLTILLVFLYYTLSLVGTALARNGKLSPFFGVWGANLIFTAAGAFFLYQMSRGGIALNLFTSIGVSLQRFLRRLKSPSDSEPFSSIFPDIATFLRRFRGILGSSFPLLLDDYIMREFVTNLLLVLSAFVSLFLIFTFFELIGDIIKNRILLVTVGEYLFNLIPFILYELTPLCALVAVLITFGALSKSSELTAMKATGISLYRIVTPVLVASLLISAGLFAFGEYYLPDANRRQESLRAVIKGKPPQTFLHPDRQWISGQPANSPSPEASTPSRIFYYQFFDPIKEVFANLSVFEFQPNTFALTRRIFASSAHWDPDVNRWVFDNGWQRTFAGDATATYQPFTVATFPEIREQPSYFVKEDRPSEEMSYSELSSYISDLKQSGFATQRLVVQLYKKIADPLTTLIMAVLAIPFALSMGKHGGLAGIATAILLAIAYWVAAALFADLGNVSTLPPILAAWSPNLLFGLAGTYLLLRTPT